LRSSDTMWNAKAQDVSAIEMKGFTSTVCARISLSLVSWSAARDLHRVVVGWFI